MNRPRPQAPGDSFHGDQSNALRVSFDRLHAAATSAQDLLQLAGLAGARGDTADDLGMALAMHEQLLLQFDVTIRTADRASADVCTVTARTSQGAYAAAAERQGDEPFGISVMPAMHGDLAAAHRALKISGSLKDALNNKALSIAIQSYARKHRTTRPTTDFKSLAANDRD